MSDPNMFPPQLCAGLCAAKIRSDIRFQSLLRRMGLESAG
jgi:hypothetical protein